MIATYFILGFIATIIGALPPGASNLAVVKTTLEENIQQALKISYGAGIGEVLLAFMALSFGMAVQDFFTMHLWIQLSTIVIFAIVDSISFDLKISVQVALQRRTPNISQAFYLALSILRYYCIG